MEPGKKRASVGGLHEAEAEAEAIFPGRQQGNHGGRGGGGGEEGRLSLSRYPLPRMYSEHIAEKPEGTVLCIHILDGQNISKRALQFSS